MPSHNRLFDRSMKFPTDELTPFVISGDLTPNFEPGLVYEGRVPFTGAIGDAVVDGWAGDLPPGATVTVDNVTKDVVVAWPAYQVEDIDVPVPIPNRDFELGAADWELGHGWTVVNEGTAQQGAWCAKWSAHGNSTILSSLYAPVTPGRVINFGAQLRGGASGSFAVALRAALHWYDADRNQIGATQGALVAANEDGQSDSSYRATWDAGVAPPGAAFVRPGIYGGRTRQNKPAYADVFGWDHYTTVGGNENTTYCLSVILRDSAGRTAEWAGCVDGINGYFDTWKVETGGVGQTGHSVGVQGLRIVTGHSNSLGATSLTAGAPWTSNTFTGITSASLPVTNVVYFQGYWLAMTTQPGQGAICPNDGAFNFANYANSPPISGNAVVINGAVYAGNESDSGTYKVRKLSAIGNAWETIDTGVVENGGGIRVIGYGDGVWIAAGGNGSTNNRVLRSDDNMATWAVVLSPLSTNFTSVAYFDGVWLIGCNSSGYLRSTDGGLTWSAPITSPVSFTHFIATTKYFLAARLRTVYRSTDGLAWTVHYDSGVNDYVNDTALDPSGNMVVFMFNGWNAIGLP